MEQKKIAMLIRNVKKEDLKPFNELLNKVCEEKIYLSTLKGPSIESHKSFLEEVLKNNYSQVVAEVDGEIIGWCDIIPYSIKEFSHVGKLGMGIKKGLRGQGIGRKLLSKCIE